MEKLFGQHGFARKKNDRDGKLGEQRKKKENTKTQGKEREKTKRERRVSDLTANRSTEI